VHVGAAHCPALHTPLVQSVGALQVAAVPQRGQAVAPPQSLSDSPWFCTLSLQVGAWQVTLQTRLVQSAAMLHVLPLLQGAQLPPQSTSVSVPFLTRSLQPAF
jgi:hypothetical protein